MKLVGIDTCIVLRLLIGEPESQAKLAADFVEKSFFRNETICINDMVVAEAYHALIYHYGVPKKEAVKSLKDLLASPFIMSTGHALAVLSSYKGTGAGLVDRLIRADLLDDAYEIMTFDKDFAKMDNVRMLKRHGA